MRIFQWNTVQNFFGALNENNVTYVIMRNFEDMDKEDFFVEGHEDIDILCEDTNSFIEASKVLCKMIPEDDIHFVTFIEGKAIPIDLRHEGDNYYDRSWERDILARRRMADNGNWYVMSEEDYYYTLVYHAILQKNVVNPQYIDKLNKMAEKLGVCLGSKDKHLKNLDHYMKRMGYRYVQPEDVSVPFQWKYVRCSQKRAYEKKISIVKTGNIPNLIRGGVYHLSHKLGWYPWLKEWQYKIIRSTYDEERGRFCDIDRFSQKVKRKYGEDIYDQLSQRRIYHYIDRYQSEIEEIRNHLPSKLILKRNQECEDAIFTMWLQGCDDVPAVVQACLKSMERIGEKIVLLTEQNLRNYIYLPDYIWEKYRSGKIGKAHFSDVVRVSALAMYGGVWIDSTVYIAGDVPDYMTKQFFVFKQLPQLRECRSYGNWWIAAPAGQEILMDQLSYLLAYWKHEDVAVDCDFFHVFFRKIIDNNNQYRQMMEKMPTRITYQTHMLLKNYDREFDEKMWEQMKELSPVFKCSYKVKGLSSYNTFYCRLCNGELG
ncbi:MAG: capsular polysaccharide synthesis protein [Clostridium sp.]|nr:capsular polysaccharide synthesis protein [Clostridium sp.]